MVAHVGSVSQEARSTSATPTPFPALLLTVASIQSCFLWEAVPKPTVWSLLFPYLSPFFLPLGPGAYGGQGLCFGDR